MEHSPSSEADCRSVSQEIPCAFMEPEISLVCSQEPVTVLYPEPDESSPHLPNLFT
jgi:hypothetical protein